MMAKADGLITNVEVQAKRKENTSPYAAFEKARSPPDFFIVSPGSTWLKAPQHTKLALH